MSMARLPLILSEYDKLIGELKNYYFFKRNKERQFARSMKYYQNKRIRN